MHRLFDQDRKAVDANPKVDRLAMQVDLYSAASRNIVASQSYDHRRHQLHVLPAALKPQRDAVGHLHRQPWRRRIRVAPGLGWVHMVLDRRRSWRFRPTSYTAQLDNRHEP